VETHRDRWKVGRMCALLSVSRSGFYAWRGRPASARAQDNGKLLKVIREFCEEGRGEYGSPTVCQAMRDSGYRVNHKRIARLMRQNGLQSQVSKQFKRTTQRCADRLASPNLLQQNFQTNGPNRVWLSDITYVGTNEGWLYLTTVEDLWSRRIVGHAIADRLEASAIVDALSMALGRRAVKPGLIFHSDRGKQYVHHGVRRLLADHAIRQSMSSTGNCYDNAPAESFYATLKKGHVFWEDLQTKEQGRRMLFEYIEVFYNRVRRHSSLGYKSPVAYEHQLMIMA